MNGIYLTQEGKQEIEAKIAEFEKERFYGSELNSDYRIGQQKVWKEILSSATILPVEESWKSTVEGDDTYEHYIENIVCFPSVYPNGVIIEPKK